MTGLKSLFFAACCALAVVGGTANAKPLPLDRIVAVVDKDVVMESELNNRIEAVQRQLSSRDIPMPPDNILKKQVLDQLILENLQLQMGQRGGIRIDDWALNDAISKIAKRNGMSVEAFRKNLESGGLSYADAREEIRREMIINRVRQRQIAERIQISDQEVDNFLKSPEGQASMQVEYRLGHILIATPDNPTPDQVREAEKKANNIAIQLDRGANFSEMALSYSSGQNALNGGDLGWRSADQLPTLFAEQALKMTDGEVSAPIRSPGGFHIFKLNDTRGNEKHMEHQIHVRHILIKPNEIRSNLEAQMLAKSLYDRIEKGEDFSELAKAYSDDTGSALNGGDLNWVSPKTLVPEFQKAMKETPEKVVSEPFKSSYGWHVLQVLGKRNSDISDKVRRNKVREILGNRKFEEELQVWLREIRDQSYIDIRL
ncbi:peptidylprolyl isomerase [Endozoicomonas sp. 8E]|uniref:peptidylprolyl isomerase n=1 Tax=Endozoicomonas sp. 8E TaxID=3035692 RepID=UPI002938FBE4|nr:peptidylprolyl isomerase [Endozoicomonas sp. 8E]WOG26392.1 peptidylprolyl isomerase [Endozoicomonas sp. 8E]